MEAEAVAAFRTAVTAALKDPALLEETKKGDRPVEPMEGAKQQKAVEEITKASASLGPLLKASVKAIQ
jgi:hypothetical protein